jgi:AraC-like DNA-binding protein
MSDTKLASGPTFDRIDPVIPVYLFHLIKTVLQERQLDTSQLTHGSGISLSDLDKEDTLVSFDQSLIMIDNALSLTGDDALGLEVGRRESLSDWGMMGYAMASCSTGQDMFRVAKSYYKTTTNLTHFDMHVSHDQLISRSEPYHSVSPPLYRFLVEEHLACHHKMTVDFHENHHLPREVHLRYAPPSYAPVYEEVFRCPVVFNAPYNQIIHSKQVLDVVNPSSNPLTKQLAIKLCDQLLQQQEQHRGLINKVERILISQPSNFPSPAEIAQQLSTSERNLRRQLKEQGSSYQQILDRVRADIAIGYLRDTQLPLEDIAHLLGFSESSSFYRAFRKWTDKAPSSYRSKP